MIWFILALIVAAILAYLESRSRYGEPDVVFAASIALGLTLALIINLGLSLVLPDKEVLVQSTRLGGPVTLEKTNDVMFYTSRDSGNLNLDYPELTTIKAGSPRTRTVVDYVVYNAWLSIFNWKNNNVVLQVPLSEEIKRVR